MDSIAWLELCQSVGGRLPATHRKQSTRVTRAGRTSGLQNRPTTRGAPSRTRSASGTSPLRTRLHGKVPGANRQWCAGRPTDHGEREGQPMPTGDPRVTGRRAAGWRWFACGEVWRRPCVGCAWRHSLPAVFRRWRGPEPPSSQPRAALNRMCRARSIRPEMETRCWFRPEAPRGGRLTRTTRRP